MLDLVARKDEPLDDLKTLCFLGSLESLYQIEYWRHEEERDWRKLLDEVLQLVLLWKEDKEAMIPGRT